MNEEINELYITGKEAFLKEDYPGALKYFNEIINRNINFADVYNYAGIIYCNNGKD